MMRSGRTGHRWLGTAVGLVLAFAAGGAGSQTAPAQAAIALQGSGPYYRLPLPTGIYGHAAHSDLSDLRVRNAAGQSVPYAWLDAAGATAAVEPGRSTLVPLFAVPAARTATVPPADPAAGEVALGLRLRPDGSLALGAASSPRAPTEQEWLIDASQVGGDLVQANFSLAAGQQGIFPFALDASDDLRRWRPLVDADALVSLDQSGRHIERLAVELQPGPARYLRLRWLDPGRAAMLNSVTLDSSLALPAAAPALEWTAAVRPLVCADDHCDYAAPRHLPIESLRIGLAEPNTLAAVHLSSLPATTAEGRRAGPRNPLFLLRHRRAGNREAAPVGEWTLVDTLLYRLDAPGGAAELRSPPLTLDGGAHEILRLRTDGGPIAALGHTPPTLSFGARPRALVFLASGSPPFTLTWSTSAAAVPAEPVTPLPLALLMAGQGAEGASAAIKGNASIDLTQLPAIVTAPTEVSSAPVSAASNKAWLWAALGLGLAVLAAMAWSLLRGLGAAAAQRPDDGPPPAA